VQTPRTVYDLGLIYSQVGSVEGVDDTEMFRGPSAR